MTRFGHAPRTREDRERELIEFLYCARPHMVLRATAADLSARYGTPLKDTEYHLRIAQQRIEREGVA